MFFRISSNAQIMVRFDLTSSTITEVRIEKFLKLSVNQQNSM